MSYLSVPLFSNGQPLRRYFFGNSPSERVMLRSSVHAIPFSGTDTATGWEDGALNLTPTNISDRASFNITYQDINSSDCDCDSECCNHEAVPEWWPPGLPGPPIPAPSDRRPKSWLERGCVACSSTLDLSLCPYCECAYVCRHHTPADSPYHRAACRKLWRARFTLQMELRGLRTLAHVTRMDFRVEQYNIANALVRMNTHLSVEKAVGLYYQLTQTSCKWSRFFTERFMIPRELLRLGRMEECYNYVKFWTRFAGLRQNDVSGEEYKTPTDGTDIWEDDLRPIVHRGGETTMNCLLVVLLIKLSLWLNIKEMQSAWCVGRKKGLANETISAIQEELACPAILNNEEIYWDLRAARPLRPHTRKLNREVVRIRDAILDGRTRFPRCLPRNRSQMSPFAGPITTPQDDALTRFLRMRRSDFEVGFAVCNNIQLMEGHLGRAVEFVMATKICPVSSSDGMYGPGNGWLEG